MNHSMQPPLVPGFSFFRMLFEYSMKLKFPFSALCFNLDSGKVCCLFSLRAVLKVWLCGNKVSFSSKPSFSITTTELWTLNLVIYKAHPRKIKNMIYKKEQWVLDTEKEEMPLCCFTELEGNWKTPSLKTMILDSQGNWNSSKVIWR